MAPDALLTASEQVLDSCDGVRERANGAEQAQGRATSSLILLLLQQISSKFSSLAPYLPTFDPFIMHRDSGNFGGNRRALLPQVRPSRRLRSAGCRAFIPPSVTT